MAPSTTSRTKSFAQFDEKTVKDLDPEAEGVVDKGSESEEGDDDVGTEHYVSTGKSSLRQDEILDKKYSGVRVSRAALDDSSDGEPDGDSEEESDDDEEPDSEVFDDPDAADLERDNIVDDEEIDSDDAFQDGEEEIFKKKGFSFKDSKANKATATKKSAAAKPLANGRSKRPVAADFMSGSEGSGSEDDQEDEAPELEEVGEESDDDAADLDNSGSEIGATDDDDDEDGSTADDDSEDGSDEEDESDDEEMGGMDTGDTTSDLRKLLKQEQASQRDIILGVSQAVKADAEKGVAVRQQRRAYDALLNLRIRLQKGLVAVNSISQATTVDDSNDTDKQPYEAAEEAAIKLWTAIDSFRTNLIPEPKPGQKRKRNFDANTPNEVLWEDMQATEERASAKRKKILEKWSQKVKSTTANASKQRQLGAAAGSQSLTSVLDNQLLSAERLVKRTHVPRSCAPIQAARKVAEDVSIYDDADFYQLLLKELVDQRSSDGTTNGSAPTVRYTAIKEAKTRKQVDRRASKGRKLRFTVHEKVENFMAPEDRRQWEDDAIDRLFGTLFGQRLGLKEDVGEDEDEDEIDAAEEGLKLFRS
ncbi:unnamed protein product [Discula destructiva]